MLKSQKYIIDSVKEAVGQANSDIYLNLFKSMSNKQYKEWFNQHLATGILNVVIPHDGSVKVTTRKNIQLIEKHGGKILGPLTITTPEEGTRITPIDFYCIDMPVRVPTQSVEKGMAVSESKSVNELTGQRASASKMTPPETGLLYGLGLDSVLEEIVRNRGGDQGLERALTTMMAKKGEVSMDEISGFEEGVTSTRTLSSFFKGIHIKLFDDI